MTSQVGISSNQAATEVHSLKESIAEFSNQASRQTNRMIKLTCVLTWLTAVMTVLVGLQAYLAIFK
jgi:Mg2+ and Co2+ transporter CorA